MNSFILMPCRKRPVPATQRNSSCFSSLSSAGPRSKAARSDQQVERPDLTNHWVRCQVFFTPSQIALTASQIRGSVFSQIVAGAWRKGKLHGWVALIFHKASGSYHCRGPHSCTVLLEYMTHPFVSSFNLSSVFADRIILNTNKYVLLNVFLVFSSTSDMFQV